MKPVIFWICCIKQNVIKLISHVSFSVLKSKAPGQFHRICGSQYHFTGQCSSDLWDHPPRVGLFKSCDSLCEVTWVTPGQGATELCSLFWLPKSTGAAEQLSFAEQRRDEGVRGEG